MSSTIDTRIEELEDRIQLYNIPVPYDGGELHDIGWGKNSRELQFGGKKFLNGGKPLSQEEHVRRTLDTEFKLPSGLVYGASFLALYDAKEIIKSKPAEEQFFYQLKNFFEESVDCFTVTSTLLRYKAQGPDQIIHDCGYPNAQQRDGTLVGPLIGSPRFSPLIGPPRFGYDDADVLEMLFGTRDVKKFNAAIKWLLGESLPLHFLRLTAKPQQDDVRVLTLRYGDNNWGDDWRSTYVCIDACTSNSFQAFLADGAVVTPSVARQKR